MSFFCVQLLVITSSDYAFCLQLLNILAVRRQQIAAAGKTDIPVPHTPPPHPGYAPNAAFHAIKRHSLEVITHRDAVVSTMSALKIFPLAYS